MQRPVGTERTLHKLELPRPTTAHPDIANHPALHNVVESLHRLLDWSLLVKPMTLEDVDVVELKSLERVLDRREDPLQVASCQHAFSAFDRDRTVWNRVECTYLSTETALVDETCWTFVFDITIGIVSLGEDNDALPGDFVLLECLAEDDLGFTL